MGASFTSVAITVFLPRCRLEPPASLQVWCQAVDARARGAYTTSTSIAPSAAGRRPRAGGPPGGPLRTGGDVTMGWLGSRCGRAAIIAMALGTLLSQAFLLRSSDPADAATSTIRNATWTNVTDTSFTVNWVTSSPLPGSGSVFYGTSATSATSQVGEQPKISGAAGDVHDAVVVGLIPSTTYFFAVSVAGTVDNNGGAYYQVKT